MNNPIDKETFAEICNARDILCNFCENTEDCETCQVTRLINDAFDSCATGLISKFEQFKPLIDGTLADSLDVENE